MKMAILLVAYGAGNQTARLGLTAFERLCRANFPGLPIRWAYTSPILRERIARQRQKSDSVAKALLRLHYERFQRVAIQPLQTIRGQEHGEVCQAARDVEEATGISCAVGSPLMSDPSEIPALARALTANAPAERDPGEPLLFMGHGARHPADRLYGLLAAEIRSLDANIHVGSMSGASQLETILPKLAPGRVWLLPLFSVIGRHALRDMAGDFPGSWRSRLEAAGRVCVPVLRGLADYPAIAQIWLANLERAASGAW